MLGNWCQFVLCIALWAWHCKAIGICMTGALEILESSFLLSSHEVKTFAGDGTPANEAKHICELALLFLSCLAEVLILC